MYIPEDHLLWDFWFAPKRPGEPFHMFHLEAPRSLADPEDRHVIAKIGHAVSDDLVHWQRLGTAFEPGTPGTWDDRAIWTGSIIEHAGLYYFFYTALSHNDRGLVQRIGLATSSDLSHWHRESQNPVLTADSRWYETAEMNPNGDEAWRDPFVIFNEDQQNWLMLFCARANQGPTDERGVVGCARSDDLLHWEAMPPIVSPGEFGQLEVPQAVMLEGRWYLLFCTGQHSAKRLARTGPGGNWHGTHYLVGEALSGPYRMLDDGPLVGDPDHDYYAGRIETSLTGKALFMGFRRFDENRRFVGGLSNPAPVHIAENRALSVDLDQLWSDGEP